MTTNILEDHFPELKALQVVRRGPTELFPDRQVCDLSDREAMGLPDHYVPGDIDDLSGIYGELFPLPVSELAAITKEEESSFVYRFVAAQIMGLKGDPRIDVMNPEMVEYPSWAGTLGLDPERVGQVLEEFGKYGVLKAWIDKETPTYEAEIAAFRIARYPVTNKEYRQFLVETKYKEIPSSWNFWQYDHSKSNHPVYSVSSDAASAYAGWLSERTGRRFRLPSEKEWEYVATNGQGDEYPWGSEFLPDACNTVESGIFMSVPIGIFPKGDNRSGVCDLAGNVEEYVSDDYGGYPGGKLIADHLVEVNGNYKVARGGSFARFRDLTRSRRRHGANPKSIYAMGFRLAESI